MCSFVETVPTLSRICPLLAIALLPTAGLAQQSATVSGRVLDDADGRPLALSAVVIEHAPLADTLSGTLAREDGRFFVAGLAPGQYAVHVSLAGFFPEELDLLVSEINLSYDLGEIRLRRLEELVPQQQSLVQLDGARRSATCTRRSR